MPEHLETNNRRDKAGYVGKIVRNWTYSGGHSSDMTEILIK